jgi:predicted nucleic acid-binding Zn ribbon protein
MRGDRKCVVCGSHYNYCPVCGKNDPYATWRYIYCSEDCRKLFNIANNWVSKKISSEYAKEQLKTITVPPLNRIQSTIRKNIEQIQST